MTGIEFGYVDAAAVNEDSELMSVLRAGRSCFFGRLSLVR